LLAAAADDTAARWARLLDGASVVSARTLLLARPEVVLVRCPVASLARAAALTTLAGAAAVVVAPLGEAVPLPWWGRRFHRFIVPDQAAAREWAAAGVALGRLVVVPPAAPDAPPSSEEGAALRTVLEEVRAMGLRPDIRRRAR
jgi:hypothetical protein